MASATRSFTILETAAKSWPVVVDVNRWVLALPDAAKKGWGDRWHAPQALTAGAPVSMLLGAQVVQEWQVEEWSPERKLRLASRVWKGREPQSMSSAIEIGMTQMTQTETLVDLKLDARFDGASFGFLFNLLVPLKGDLNRLLAHMEKGIIAALSGA
jgi:hypothetical protein